MILYIDIMMIYFIDITAINTCLFINLCTICFGDASLLVLFLKAYRDDVLFLCMYSVKDDHVFLYRKYHG